MSEPAGAPVSGIVVTSGKGPSVAYMNRQEENLARRRRTNRNTLIVVGVVLGLLCLCGGIGAVFGADDEPEKPATTPPTGQVTPAATATRSAPVTSAPRSGTTGPAAPPATGVAPERDTSRTPVLVEPEPSPSPVPPPPPSPVPAPAPPPVPEWTPEPTVVAPPPAPAPSGVTYGSCADARAAGAAPLYAGQPGYSRKLDRDGDGVACE
ncbi:excalibur calcium-binding domain-containing protein [Nocardia sp. NPDC024068]|uniref:excalibur calcium-binding domain-containing protein n=1 Tax=Nocardia sp. NPDC024068 TaxID=3157197 RepID=UPI0033FF5D6B